MSPEQLRSLKDVDARTDVWALSNLEVRLAIEPGVPWQPVDLVPVRPWR
jgi:hypothetical protein